MEVTISVTLWNNYKVWRWSIPLWTLFREKIKRSISSKVEIIEKVNKFSSTQARFCLNWAWVELNKFGKRIQRSKAFLFEKVKGGYSVAYPSGELIFFNSFAIKMRTAQQIYSFHQEYFDFLYSTIAEVVFTLATSKGDEKKV